MLKYLFISLSIILFAAGCSSSGSKTVYYSLDTPQKNTVNYGIQVEQFTSCLPFEKNMTYAVTSNGVVLDDYNNWLQPPAALLTQYFNLALNNPDKQKSTKYSDLKLSGSILRLECSTETGLVTLSLSLTVTDKDSNVALYRIYTKETRLNKVTASAYAKAVSTETEEISSQLIEQLGMPRP